jgi:glucose-6-phosphate 1-dehydrogenase
MTPTVEANQIVGLTPARLPQGDSCILVIFGASGDLAKRKLIPSLYNLACVGCMNPSFEVLGTGRTAMTDEQFRTKMREAASKASDTREFSPEVWQEFEKQLHYFTGDINDPAFYVKLRERLEGMTPSGSSPNHLFYLSTPASQAPIIIKGLGTSGLNHSEGGWARVILEKPFGRDLASAHELNQTVLKVFDEGNVYRIDHYLGKETVQNILVFRFANSLYEPVWNRNYIDYVEITGAETVGVEGRASFYEETGALRDMVANHLLQLLALTAMEPPVAFDADSIRQQKVQVLRSIRPMTVAEVAERTLRGQYGPGQVGGKPMPGYRQEPGVKPDSVTETFVALKLYIDNWRWAGVPFHIRTGKHLARAFTEIRIHLKRTPQALFSTTPEDQVERNIITLRIQPNEGISISFGAKRPGSQMRTVSVQADFSYRAMFGSNSPVAYETLLLDSMLGDPTLFTSRDEVEAEWRIITPIEEAWTQLPAPKFPNYAAGSDGPVIPPTLF